MIQNPRRKIRRTTRRTGFLAAMALALVLGLAACYPGGPEDLGDIGVVVTIKNPSGDFTNLMTYAMEDTVVELDNPNDSSSTPINPAFNDVIIEELHAQMDAAGFRQVDPDVEKPDVVIRVGAVESEVWVYYYNWGYYGGYPGWGYYYPPYMGTTSYQQGTLIWDLNDMRNVDDPSDPESKPLLNWVGSLNGALSKSASTTESSIRTGIRQAFTQSPYIVGHSVEQ